MKLTPKQELFCKYYIESLNATQSAIRAGYSEKVARQIGCENLAKPNIKAFIDENMKKLDNIMTINEILKELTDIARCNKTPTFAKIKALELLGKRYGLWLDNQVNHEKTVVNIINDIS